MPFASVMVSTQPGGNELRPLFRPVSGATVESRKIQNVPFSPFLVAEAVVLLDGEAGVVDDGGAGDGRPGRRRFSNQRKAAPCRTLEGPC